MAGLSLGIGARGGGYNSGGTIGGDDVFMSPITPDLSRASKPAVDHPSVWVLGGCAVWMAIVFVHFKVY